MRRESTNPSAGAPEIEAISRPTLGSVIGERLRELVIHRAFPPGTQLNAVDLAERFGVSRGPVREALQVLVQEGLLRNEPRRGVFVPIIGDEDIADIYVAREAIEAATFRASLQVDDRRQSLAEGLGRVVAEMRAAAEAGRWNDVADLDMEFHRQVVVAAGSPRLIRMYAMLMDETRSCVNLSAAYPGREDLVDEHAELLALIEARDETGLLDALRRHFAEALVTLRSHRRVPVQSPSPTQTRTLG
jgi:DNA-binding GntR family transcriptional regulator